VGRIGSEEDELRKRAGNLKLEPLYPSGELEGEAASNTRQL